MNINIKKSSNFNYDKIPVGYYDKIFKKEKGIQSKWHHTHYNYVKKIMGSYTKHLDLACAGGTFIGNLSDNKKSFGVDISIKQINYAKKFYTKKNANIIFLFFFGFFLLNGDSSLIFLFLILTFLIIFLPAWRNW